jgi:hypothetical protein
VKRTRLRPFSAKREAIRDERQAFVERILRERPACEAPAYLRAVVHGLPKPDQDAVVAALRLVPPGCRSAEVHELLSRARGGSIVEDANCAALCSRHHQWVTEHPRLATMAGLMRSRWG